MDYPTTTVQIAIVLRNTLRRLEQTGTFRSNDPALIHLKRQLILSIAELEMRKDFRLSSEREEPIILLRVRKAAAAKRESELELCAKER
jgi:hypothetical protein